MTTNCVVSQVHIPDFDVQGGLTAAEKLQLVAFGVEHLRRFNPNCYIILCGHGHYPAGAAPLCDKVIWNRQQEPLNEHGYVEGMPAQFKYVSAGLEVAREKGFDRVLKTRGDCVIGVPDIIGHCDRILDQEGRRLLITQQTGPDRLGDCFMFGETGLLCRTWHSDNVVVSSDGLQNTAYHFRRALGSAVEWERLVKATCSFRDVHNLKFTCLRWNWRSLAGRLAELLDEGFNFASYHWGRANGWHHFTADGNMTGTAGHYWCEKGYYDG